MSICNTAFIMVGCFALGCSVQNHPAAPTGPFDRYEQAYEQGREQFGAELARGEVFYDAFAADASKGIDGETGLPTQVVPGDASDMNAAGRVSGHNDAIREYIQKYGDIPGSRKKFEPDLLRPAEYFLRQAKDAPSISLRVGGGHVMSSDGRFTLVLRDVASGAQPASSAHELILFGQNAEMVVSGPEDLKLQKSIDLVWGPAGSDTAVVHIQAHDHDIYATLDLRTARWLAWESAATDDRLTKSAG